MKPLPQLRREGRFTTAEVRRPTTTLVAKHFARAKGDIHARLRTAMLPLDPAPENSHGLTGFRVGLRAVRVAADQAAWTSSVGSSLAVHAVAIAGLYVGAWIWHSFSGAPWEAIPPQHGASSMASAGRVVELAPLPVRQDEATTEPVSLSSAKATEIEPRELALRRVELSPVGETAFVEAAEVDAEATVDVSASLANVNAPKRAAMSLEVAAVQPITPAAVARQASTHAPPESAAANAATIAKAASAASRASEASHGAQSMPAPVFNPTPVYPADLMARRIEGLVKLRVELNAEGKVVRASVSQSSGYAAFDRAALEVIYRWRFTSTQPDASTTRRLTVPIRFGIVD